MIIPSYPRSSLISVTSYSHDTPREDTGAYHHGMKRLALASNRLIFFRASNVDEKIGG